MEVGIVIDTISTLGFPIALTIACVWMFYKCYTWQREDNKEREVRDRETIERFSGIIAENSKALLKNSETMEIIANKLEDVSEDVKEMQKDIIEIKANQNQHKE